LEVKNFALTSEKFVRNAEASHGFEMQTDNGVGDDLGDFGFFAAIFFNGFKGAGAKFVGARFVVIQKVGDFGVEIPAVVVEARLHGGHFHANGSEPLHIEEADDDIGDLDAGVVNVILDLNG